MACMPEGGKDNHSMCNKIEAMNGGSDLISIKTHFNRTTADIPATISTELHKLLIKAKWGKKMVLVKDRSKA